MSTLTISIFTVGLALLVIFGIVMINHVSALVKNAYQIKVEIRSEMEDGLSAIAHEMEQKARAIRQDMQSEATRIKTMLEADNQKQFAEMDTALKTKLSALEEVIRQDRVKFVKAIDEMQQMLRDHEQSLRTWKRDQKAATRTPEESDKDSPAAAGAAGG
ncbi:MAG: hypothetical protein ABT940_00030 [Alphaproteobacteria bacterium]